MFVNRVLISKLKACVFICAISMLAGCDQISSVFDKLSHKSSQKTDVMPTQTLPTPVINPTTSENQASIQDKMPENVIARVGNWSITLDQFNSKLTKLKEILPDFNPSDLNSKKLILEELVRQELLVKNAEEMGIANDKEILETVEDFRKTLLVQEVATQLTKDIKVTEDDARSFYDKNKDNFTTKTEWKVREIVVDAEPDANDILVQLLQGGDFVELAKSKSKSSTASKGGDMGWLEKFPNDQMRAAVTALEKGKTSGVFKGPSGYYIVKLEDKRGGAPKPFLAVKTDLIKRLTLKKQQEAVLDHLNELATKTKIEVNEELLK